MAVVGRCLVIGGGFSGMAAAIRLAETGWTVDLVEIDPDWRSYGAGISLNGAIFRAFRTLGILEAFAAAGAASDGVEMRAGPEDRVVMTIPTPRVDPDLPGNGGIMRPVLAGILAARVRALGVTVRLGLTWDTLAEDTRGVHVRFRDGSAATYDLVVGADGVYSALRARLFPEAPAPRYMGQAVWRAVVPRSPALPTVTMWMGARLKAGINHVSATESYLFLTEDRPTNDRVPPETFVPALRALLAQFPSPYLAQVAAGLGPDSRIVFRPLEQLLLPRPWHRGRVVLIGDAVHATTPHMAAGAMIGLEDAIVLAEALGRADGLDAALAAFQDRRWERCRMVVENSGRLCEIEVSGGDKAEHARIMGQTLAALAQPA